MMKSFPGMMRACPPLGLLLLSACAQMSVPAARDAPANPSLVTLQVIAFNDFHGHIDPDDQTVLPPDAPTDAARIKAGGAIHFADAVERLRSANPLSVVVSAGDLISAAPLISGHFLDEPTIRVMNEVSIDFNAVGNHEFDRGPDELLRMQAGGCAQFTSLEPCRVMPDFPGAEFKFLAANVQRSDGTPLFPAFGIKRFEVDGHSVGIGFVGMTLEGAAEIVVPGAVADLRFMDEAEAANALVPRLRAAGADILVVLVHEGGYMNAEGDQGDCSSMGGALPEILSRLDPAFDLVISGHTHQSYVCSYGTSDPSRPFLTTSAGQYGTQLTQITLDYDLAGRKLVNKRAQNVLVTQSPDANITQPKIASLVERYRAAAVDARERVVGSLAGPLTPVADASGQSTLGNFIADAQLAAMRGADRGGAQFAIMNRGGLRASITPTGAGEVLFGDLYSAQPFGNTVMVKQLTGAQIRAALEQQFTRGPSPVILSVSRGFTYAFDASAPAGQRVFDIRIEGVPLSDEGTYRVTMNNFIAQGGDGFELFADAPVIADGPVDVEALEVYIATHAGRAPPALDRIRNLSRGEPPTAPHVSSLDPVTSP